MFDKDRLAGLQLVSKAAREALDDGRTASAAALAVPALEETVKWLSGLAQLKTSSDGEAS